MLTCVELFAGAGGLALGLEQAGFTHVALVEREKLAAQTLRANFDPALVVEADVRELDHAEWREVDLLAGGPPCQPFTVAGRREGQADERDMIPEFARALAHMAPRAFLMENVQGLTTARHRDYLENVLASLAEPRPGLRYRVCLDVLNAADYGAPQARRRLIVVGWRDDQHAEVWAKPAPTHSLDALLYSQRPGGEYWARHPIPEADRLPYQAHIQRRAERVLANGPGPLLPQRTFRDATAHLGEPPLDPERGQLAHALRFPPHPRPGLEPREGTRPDLPARTVIATANGAKPLHNIVRAPDWRCRVITIPEARALQTFPPTHVIEAPSHQAAIRLIGNSVPPLLGEAIGKTIAQQLRYAELAWRKSA